MTIFTVEAFVAALLLAGLGAAFIRYFRLIAADVGDRWRGDDEAPGGGTT